MDFKFDFALVKERVSVPMVLERYGMVLKPEGDKLRGPCPFQDGHGKTAFIAWERGWKCHSCGRKGNVLDFVAAKESVAVLEAVKLLYGWFNLAGASAAPAKNTPAHPAPEVPEATTEDTATASTQNAPLKFELKGIDPAHEYGKARGFEPGHCEYLGCGFFPGKGSMAGRWVFPVHNAKGELVSYAGRLVDDSAVSDERPRWLLGKGFHKSLELYNLHRVLRGEFSEVVVMEGFWGVASCVRAGILNSVALMGRTLSEAQTALLVQFPSIVLLLDGDEPGRQASQEVGAQLLGLPNRESVKVLFLPADIQPDSLEPDAVQALIW